MEYPEASTLPFNTSPLSGNFICAYPNVSDPDEPGFWIIVQGDALVIEVVKGNQTLIEGEIPPWVVSYAEPLLIGSWKGSPVRILEIGTDSIVPCNYIAEPLLQAFFHEKIPDDLLSLVGRAQQILAWEKKSVVCPRCGGDTDRISGTWGKKCRGCSYEHFPAIHPCTLVLVSRGKEVLLVRKAEWPPGYYSLPSGFCDFGESLEECARREVEEETGIKISNLRYLGSQCWPFPSQLMVGFSAEFSGGEIVVDKEELEDAAWFERNSLPPSFSQKSIAGWMIHSFA